MHERESSCYAEKEKKRVEEGEAHVTRFKVFALILIL